MCNEYYIHYIRCDHYASDYDQKCPLYRADPFRFNTTCFPQRFTSSVDGKCSVCQTGDPTLGRFGLIPNHSRSTRGPNGEYLTGDVKWGGPVPPKPARIVTDIGIVCTAPKDEGGRPVDAAGRRVPFMESRRDDGRLSFASTASYGGNGSGPLRHVQFLKGWVRQTRNGLMPFEPEVGGFSGSTLSVAQYQGADGGWSSSVRADTSDGSYRTEDGMISRNNLVYGRSPRLMDWDGTMPSMEPSPDVIMEEAVQPEKQAEQVGQKDVPKQEPKRETAEERRARVATEKQQRQEPRSYGLFGNFGNWGRGSSNSMMK